jgi:hypothetical protein
MKEIPDTNIAFIFHVITGKKPTADSSYIGKTLLQNDRTPSRASNESFELIV